MQEVKIMKHEMYIVSEGELELLDKYGDQMANLKDTSRYDNFSKESLAAFCRMKDKSINLLLQRCKGAREVIDILADEIGMNDLGLALYFPDEEGSSPILRRISGWVERSGEKAQLKKKVQELERENSLLRSLLQK